MFLYMFSSVESCLLSEQNSCSHCSCIIFISTSYSLNIQVILILILIDVQYLQSVVSIFKKGSNGHSHSSSDSHHMISPNPTSTP